MGAACLSGAQAGGEGGQREEHERCDYHLEGGEEVDGGDAPVVCGGCPLGEDGADSGGEG